MYFRLFLLGALLAGVSAIIKFPKCNKEVIENIEAYWKGAGVPQKVLSSEGVFTAYKSSNIAAYNGVKCRKYDFIPEGKIKSTIDGTEKTYVATEKNGVITHPDRKTYVIMNDDGVIAGYNCSEDDDAPPCVLNQADGSILVTEKANPNSVAHAEGLLRLLDFRPTKVYSCK